MNPSIYDRYRYVLLGFALCLAPLAALGAVKALGTNANDVRTWLPQGLPEAKEYAWFGRHFGTEEFVAVSWEDCTLDDHRLELFADSLQGARKDQRGESVLVDTVLTGKSALKELVSPPLNLTHNEAVARLRGFAIGPDGRQACAVVRPAEKGKQNPHALLEAVYRAAQQCGVSRNDVRMGGPLVTSVAVDRAANSSLNVLGLASIAAAVLFSWLCFRSWRLTFLVVAVGVFAAVAALAAVWFSGGEMNAVLVSMPPLVYVATMSGAIHWANYYRDEVTEHGLERAPSRAVGKARLPLALATGTTAVGLLSLCGSDLLPIRQFGFYSACGVAGSLVWLLLILPAGCAVWPLRSIRRESPSAPGVIERSDWWSWGRRITSRSGMVTLVGLTLAAICGLGLSHIKTSVTAEGFFPDEATYPRDCRWLEERLGGIVPMEIVLRMDATCRLNMLERLELVQRVEQSLASLEGVGTSISAVTFSPKLPGGADRGWSVERSVFNRRLERHRDHFVEAGLLASAEGEELWRISLRTRSFQDVDQRYFLDAVRDRVTPVLDDHSGGGVSAVFTGMAPLIERSQQSLLEGLMLGLTTDLALIVIVIIVLVRHWSVGLVLLVTSVFPVIVVLGVMGWLGVVLDIGSVLAPAVALGVTVDDVLHFVLWFRRGLERGMDRPQSVRLAYSVCARAMYQSWCVIGVGLSLFALSDFTPTRRFGLLMIALLSVGLLVNLVLLPALLAGPLGRILENSVVKRKTADGPEPLVAACCGGGPC